MSHIFFKGNGMVQIEDNRRVTFLESRKIKTGKLLFGVALHQDYHLRQGLCPHMVSLNDRDSYDDLLQKTVYGFIETELTGKWYRTMGLTFCFELEEDAMAFKLRWA